MTTFAASEHFFFSAGLKGGKGGRTTSISLTSETQAKKKSAPAGIKRQLSDQSKLFDNVFNKGDPDNVAQRLVDRETTLSQEVQEIKKKANKKGGRRTRRRRSKRRKRRSRRGGAPTLEECRKAFPTLVPLPPRTPTGPRLKRIGDWRGRRRGPPPKDETYKRQRRHLFQPPRINARPSKDMIVRLMNKNKKGQELNRQDSGIGGVYDAIDDAFSTLRLDTSNKLRISREKGKGRGGKKKRKRTKKKKRRRRKRTKKKRRR